MLVKDTLTQIVICTQSVVLGCACYFKDYDFQTKTFIVGVANPEKTEMMPAIGVIIQPVDRYTSKYLMQVSGVTPRIYTRLFKNRKCLVHPNGRVGHEVPTKYVDGYMVQSVGAAVSFSQINVLLGIDSLVIKRR